MAWRLHSCAVPSQVTRVGLYGPQQAAEVMMARYVTSEISLQKTAVSILGPGALSDHSGSSQRPQRENTQVAYGEAHMVNTGRLLPTACKGLRPANRV